MSEAEPYLTRLTNRLLDGIERLPDEVRARNTQFLLLGILIAVNLVGYALVWRRHTRGGSL